MVHQLGSSQGSAGTGLGWRFELGVGQVPTDCCFDSSCWQRWRTTRSWCKGKGALAAVACHGAVAVQPHLLSWQQWLVQAHTTGSSSAQPRALSRAGLEGWVPPSLWFVPHSPSAKAWPCWGWAAAPLSAGVRYSTGCLVPSWLCPGPRGPPWCPARCLYSVPSLWLAGGSRSGSRHCRGCSRSSGPWSQAGGSSATALQRSCASPARSLCW